MTSVGDVLGGVTVVVQEGKRGDGKDRPLVGPTFRFVSSKDDFPTLAGATTLYESFKQSVTKFGDRPCLGWRPKGEDGKAGPFEFMTYAETYEKVQAVGSAISATGIAAHGKIAIYSGNTPEWMITMQACNLFTVYCVPIYDSLGENAVEYTINHAEAQLVFLSIDKLPLFVKAVPQIKSKLKGIVYWGEGAPSSDDLSKLKAMKIKLYTWDEFVTLGEGKPKEPTPPKPDDPCCIMYTSGTTGDPKGVLITHKNVVSGIAAAVEFVHKVGLDITDRDSTLSYLPLAHIFDRLVEEFALAVGGAIGYYQGNVKLLTDDVAALRPTLFIAVPRVLERMASGIQAKIRKMGFFPRLMFHLAYAFKRWRLSMGVAAQDLAPWLDNIVFAPIKKGFGGRLRFVVSGGAPLAPHIQEFLTIALCCPVLQGYGLTESNAASFFTHPPPANHGGTVGPPLPATEFRLQGAPDLGYDPFANPPRGEICLRGPMIFGGYYKMPDKTAKEFDDEGFFHTGDVGEVTPNGCLKVIDRMKNMFKLAQGEYIAAEKLEVAYSESEAVEQVWVYGNSYESVLVAVVVPDSHALKAWAEENGLSGGIEELCQNGKAREWMVGELSKTGKAKRLKGFEMIKGVYLEPEQFSVENDLMTPSFKLKRPQLQKRYQKEIDSMYKAIKAKFEGRG